MTAGSPDLPRIAHPHASKFRLVLAALVGIAVAAVAIAVVVAARHSGGSGQGGGQAWSRWAPNSSGSAGVAEIAQHTALFYRLDAAQQLDVVTPISVSQASAAGTTTGNGLAFAVNTSAGKRQSLALLNGNTVGYNLCGLGAKSCELAGTPSTARMLLLRREALELALYTFKYISGAQDVVVVLPPGHPVASAHPGSHVTVAVAFLRSELAPWLQVPLARTLAQYPPALSQLGVWSKTTEAGFVNQITAPALFSTQVESLQVGGRVLVLTQIPAQ